MRLKSRCLVFFAIAWCAAQGPPRCAADVTLTITPNAVYQVANANLYVVAIVPTLVTGGVDASFQMAFDTWNNTLAAADQWSLANGGALDKTAKFNVSTYRAAIVGGSGGLEVQIDYTQGTAGVKGPNPIADRTNIKNTDAVWAQALSTKTKAAGALPGNPYLDNPTGLAGTQLGPPAYPFQYNGSFLYDFPHRPPTETWTAVAYLSTADYTSRTLTVYDGVKYGFSVGVPEPSPVLLCGTAGLIGLAVARYRRRTAA